VDSVKRILLSAIHHYPLSGNDTHNVTRVLLSSYMHMTSKSTQLFSLFLSARFDWHSSRFSCLLLLNLAFIVF
jgi:hypothetical protein